MLDLIICLLRCRACGNRRQLILERSLLGEELVNQMAVVGKGRPQPVGLVPQTSDLDLEAGILRLVPRRLYVQILALVPRGPYAIVRISSIRYLAIEPSQCVGV